ncbi:MAG: LysM peptidoglycan-binding domain-containing protein [Treponema sp.]|jgi:membrane-bound lytic murein transglycosylase D|nr:LysM peptidoglycan-binding domain-containing protein [Treponema sp.]
MGKNSKTRTALFAGPFLFLVLSLGAQEDPASLAGEFPRPLRRQIFSPPERLTSSPAAGRIPADPPALSISGIAEPLTQEYINRYTKPAGLAWLKESIERGAPYLGFIREEIAKRGLPAELLYLPVIESGYVPGAVSRSGAAGLWQFMRNSIAPFDMRVDGWIDERMDFWKSTQGALRKLEENYQILGDWALALAAYNAGLGGVNQAIKRGGVKDYWELSRRKILRTETVHYVPKFLAAAHILSQPRKYGLESWRENARWTRVPAGKMVDLSILAQEAAIDPVLLREGNRELLYNASPPESGHLIKVPAESAARVEEVLNRQGLELMRNYYYHTISFGDTLSALALHYGVSVSLIEKTNPGIRSHALRIGSRLKIPALKEVKPYTNNAQQGGDAASFTGIYLVKKGDTLWSIALAYGTDPLNLARANNMDIGGLLREGRTLKVPIR